MCKNKDGRYSFSFMEMINSESTGKTSATAVTGIITCLVMLAMFVILAIYFMGMKKHVSIEDIELIQLKEEGVLAIINYCTVMFGMGTALLGVRNIAGAFGSKRQKQCDSNNSELVNKEEQEKNINKSGTEVPMNEIDV